VTGYVNDIREYITRARVVVCPILTGTGTRNKILQAWARQRPVVSTSVGASGLEYSDNENILIADSRVAFARRVVSLMENSELWEKISGGGRKTVEQKYDIAKIVTGLNTVLEGLQKQIR
jgi:glycosyltransferase involved in cell wall biosynthesis